MPNGLTDLFQRVQQNVTGFFSKDSQPSGQGRAVPNPQRQIGPGLGAGGLSGSVGNVSPTGGHGLTSLPLRFPKPPGGTVSPSEQGHGEVKSAWVQPSQSAHALGSVENSAGNSQAKAISPAGKQPEPMSKAPEGLNLSEPIAKKPEVSKYSLSPDQIHRNPATLRSFQSANALGYWNPHNFLDPFGH